MRFTRCPLLIFRCNWLRAARTGPEELLPELLPQLWLVPMRLPAQSMELNTELLFWVLMFRPTMSDEGNWELWTKVWLQISVPLSTLIKLHF